MSCQKRQTVVTRDSEGSATTFRCLHRKCEAYGTPVTDETCLACPMASLKRPPPPCRKPCTDCDTEEQKILAENPDGPPPDFPKITVQAWLYQEALRKWNSAGRPVRTEEEINAIHAEHCTGCSWYEKDKKRCRGCGCRVATSGVAVFNKIKMATEHCPRDFW